MAGALPTRARLAYRFHINCLLCPLCHADVKNEIHLFFCCSFARALWFALPWCISWDRFLDFDSIFLFEEAILDSKGLLVCHYYMDCFHQVAGLVFDQIWKCRNDVVFCSVMPHMYDVVGSILCRLTKFSSYKEGSCHTISADPVLRIWVPPVLGVVKVNVDVSLSRGKSFVGLVARNCRGCVLHLSASKIQVRNVEVVEANALVLGLPLALSMGWRCAVLEVRLSSASCCRLVL